MITFNPEEVIKSADLNANFAELKEQTDKVASFDGAWQSWTPTYANLTVGNGTVVAKYTQIGKTVHLYWKFTLGSTSSVGAAPTLSLPINQATADARINSTGRVSDASPTSESMAFLRNNTSDASTTRLGYYSTTSVAQNITATSPFTWATNDVIEIAGTYEAA